MTIQIVIKGPTVSMTLSYDIQRLREFTPESLGEMLHSIADSIEDAEKLK